MDRRRFFRMFGSGAGAALAVAPVAVLSAVDAEPEPKEISAEEALRDAFLREVDVMLWERESHLSEVKAGLDVLEQLDRLGIRPIRRN